MSASRKYATYTEELIKPMNESESHPMYASVVQLDASLPLNVTNLKYEDLLALQNKIAKEIEAQKVKAQHEFKEEIIARAASFGVTVDELFGFATRKPENFSTRKKRSDAGVKQEPYYRNPNNPEEIAYKKGKKPFWLQDLIASGVDLESLRIQ